MLAGYLALMFASAAAGAALYIFAAEQPARLRLDSANLLVQWKGTYKRGIVILGALWLLSSLAGLIAAWLLSSWYWYVGAALMLGNVPVTHFAIFPISRVLAKLPASQAGDDARALIVKWGHLHGVRALLSAIAAYFFLLALVLD